MYRTHRGLVLGLYRHGPDRQLLEDALTCGVRAVDTAYNYLGFNSHRALSETAGDLLPGFSISTKVGFFPTAGRPRHSLNPARLRYAIQETTDDLGRAPQLVFLHNPEHTLRRLPQDHARDVLAAACAALADAVAEGLCEGWGIASWNPRPLLPLLGPGHPPGPAALMTRCGLLVDAATLSVIDELADALGVGPSGRWGMSPFGGDTTLDVWRTFDARTMLRGAPDVPALHTAFRVAYELPTVSHIAVGTSSARHLRELVGAAGLPVDPETVSRYRELIAERAAARS